MEYGLYVNDGHRVVNRAGETVGFVEGEFFLEHAVHTVDNAMGQEFRREVEEVNREHDR
ncbi:hypothetical protein SDC9_151795 [bioreactor metagenome]|uniref:Uncharacterized protein n=1 Tax=bioreactor metagenome TaxID=1076179 RepID=A0A645EVP9_9ZZZZ